jgi:hypothetical protein
MGEFAGESHMEDAVAFLAQRETYRIGVSIGG